jgi:ATP phosphoribosyltransferase
MGPVAERLTLALPKGRILDAAKPMLAEVGVDLAPIFADRKDRRLRFDLGDDLRVFLVKPVDVPTYVAHGIAHVGIAGLDTLEEEQRDLYVPVDLGIGRCRMSIAEPKDRPASMRRGDRIRVASKYANIAERHYRRRGIQAQIIKLYGSVELGPLTGLADQIVDVVESGETLRQNGLVEVETLFEVSSRLVVHPPSLKLRRERIEPLIEGLRRIAQSQLSEAKSA